MCAEQTERWIMEYIQNHDRIITAKERREMIPYSDMHIWRMENDGKFPKRLHLGPKRIGWSYNEVHQWIDDRKAERV